jgi:hypothetical protein
MGADLETAWIEASAEERSQYLGQAWRAAGEEQRAAVLRENAPWALEAAWIAASGAQRKAFVSLRAREVATALDAALLLPPPDWSPLQRESKQSLARRLNTLEQSHPALAEVFRGWRRVLGVPLGIKRGMPPPDRPAAGPLRYRNPNLPRRGRNGGAKGPQGAKPEARAPGEARAPLARIGSVWTTLASPPRPRSPINSPPPIVSLTVCAVWELSGSARARIARRELDDAGLCRCRPIRGNGEQKVSTGLTSFRPNARSASLVFFDICCCGGLE